MSDHTVSGGKNNTAPKVILTSPDFRAKADYFKNPKPLYFGFTAGTGGLGTVIDVLSLNIKVPPAF